jgi:hypothetical protein
MFSTLAVQRPHTPSSCTACHERPASGDVACVTTWLSESRGRRGWSVRDAAARSSFPSHARLRRRRRPRRPRRPKPAHDGGHDDNADPVQLARAARAQARAVALALQDSPRQGWWEEYRPRSPPSRTWARARAPVGSSSLRLGQHRRVARARAHRHGRGRQRAVGAHGDDRRGRRALALKQGHAHQPPHTRHRSRRVW